MIDFILSLGKDGLKNAYSALQEFALYLTLALALIVFVCFLVFNFKLKSKLETFKKFTFGFVFGYALTLTLCISFFMVARLIVKQEIDLNFYLVLGFLALCVLYCISSIICYLIGKKAFKICNIAGISCILAYLAVLLFLLPTVEETYSPLSFYGMYIFSFILIAIVVLITFLFDRKNTNIAPTKSMAYAGVSIALAFALSYIKLFSMPQGGSVTLASMLPLIIYSYVFGVKKGVFAGIVYGTLQCLQSPQIYQPMQVLLDYPVAFACIGLSGIARNFNKIKFPAVKFIIGATIGCVGRYFAHFLSGYYVFSSWAMAGYTALTWSLVYNLYIVVELLIILFVGCVLFSSKSFNKEITKLYNGE